MKIGTKSVLFGAHCFFIHPWFVAAAWWRLYGFPFDPRLWVAFFVHDLGYIGKPNMDGSEGEQHPFWGAFVMGALFGKRWYEFTLYHSRFLAKNNGAQFSKLCVADKFALTLTPAWLYLPMARSTGEILEYMKEAKVKEGKYFGAQVATMGQKAWYKSVQTYMRSWVVEHSDGRIDTWTPDRREPINDQGVWK